MTPELVNRVITPALERGEVVLSDRYLLANVVYQGYAGGLNPDEIRTLSEFATAGIHPDLTVVLDLPADIARRRRTGLADRVESRGADYFERVRTGFLTEAARDPQRFPVVDASPSIEIVHAAIVAIIDQRLRAG